MDRSKNEEEDYDPYVLRVRGLPWSASKDDIVKFFEGCKLKNGANGIHLTMSREGRPSGEAYVEFETTEDADKGLEKNNEHLGSRYIEVFRSKQNEMEWALHRCGLDGQEAFGDACVRLRGLPFGCSKEEIAQFFTEASGGQTLFRMQVDHGRRHVRTHTDERPFPCSQCGQRFRRKEHAQQHMYKHLARVGK